MQLNQLRQLVLIINQIKLHICKCVGRKCACHGNLYIDQFNFSTFSQLSCQPLFSWRDNSLCIVPGGHNHLSFTDTNGRLIHILHQQFSNSWLPFSYFIIFWLWNVRKCYVCSDWILLIMTTNLMTEISVIILSCEQENILQQWCIAILFVMVYTGNLQVMGG